MYCIFGQIGNRLLYKNKDAKKNRRNYRPVFMLLIIVWFAYGNVSLYTAETFIMTRTWQGKGLMAGIVLPALFLCIMYLASDKVTKGVWLLFVCVIVSAVFATSIAFMLVPTVVGLAAIMIALRKKDIKICCVDDGLLSAVFGAWWMLSAVKLKMGEICQCGKKWAE